VLNQISLFWFQKMKNLVPNHIITADVKKMGFDKDFLKQHAKSLEGRSIHARLDGMKMHIVVLD
jgi:phosphoribosylaminoimidazole-succinocarboxamide synthase